MRSGLLARHFFWRFFDNDLVSPDSDAHQAASLAVGFVATPGILVSGFFFFKYGNPWLAPPNRLSLALVDKLQFISWSMLVMALAAVVVWDALALDARDYAILGSLPIRRRTLLAGKLAAVASLVAVFALATNGATMVLFPLAFLSSSHLPLAVGFWVMLGHAVACLGAALFAFLAVLAVRGLLQNVLGARLFARASLPARFVIALVVITGSSSLSIRALDQAGPQLYLSPPMWFLGLYETVANRGIMASLSSEVTRLFGLVDVGVPRSPLSRQVYVEYWPVLQHLATIAVAALAAAGLFASVLYFFGHVRQGSGLRLAAWTTPRRAAARSRVLARLVRRLVVRDPVAQAGFFFTLQTLGRSARHRLYLAGYFLVGCVLTYTAVMSLATTRAASASGGPGSDALAIQFVLSFFLIVGIRVAFTFPAELRANWTFRLTVGSEATLKRYLAGVRRAVAVGLVLPFLFALGAIHAVLWGPQVAALHFVCGFLWALVLAEMLLLGFAKLPFTCAHVAGSANVKVFGAAYVMGFLAYAYGFAALERAALTSPAGSAALIVALMIVLAGLAAYRRRLMPGSSGLVFEESPDAAVVTLGL
jgi:hypothetical protein